MGKVQISKSWVEMKNMQYSGGEKNVTNLTQSEQKRKW